VEDPTTGVRHVDPGKRKLSKKEVGEREAQTMVSSGRNRTGFRCRPLKP
jgi:hypothetical protein